MSSIGPMGEGLPITTTENKTENITETDMIRSSPLSSFIQASIPTAMFYPLYRLFIEKKNIALQKDFTKEKLRGVLKQARERGGVFCGFNSFMVSKMLKFAAINSFQDSPWLYIPLCGAASIISYPFMLNSNLKALNLPGVASLKSYSDMSALLTQRSSYKGISYFLLSEVLFVMPFVNLLSHRFETLRLAYVFGPYYDHEFGNYKEAKNYLKQNKLFYPGRFIYNFIPHCINAIVLFSMTTNLLETKKLQAYKDSL